MNRQGVAQTNRGLGGIGQVQPSRNNNSMVSSNRLQQQPNRMASSQSQWPFQGAAPGLPAPQSRAPGMATSFAQTIGGNQNATPLDPSEFPSLSGGGPSTQAQNHNQAIWSGQRQHTPIQQQQQRSQQRSKSGNQQSSEDHGQQNLEDGFFGASAVNSMDDFRRGHNGVGQLSSSNPQPGSVEEFPPLGRGGNGEIGGDRRLNMMQAVSGAFGNGAPGFPPGIGPNRTPQESLRSNSRPIQTGNDNSLFSSMNETSQAPIGSGQRQATPVSANQSRETSLPTKTNGTSASNMTDEDKYGLPGLLDAIKNENNENFNLAIGHDLTTLGLDLNSTDPLYPTFGGPLATRNARAMTPEFSLPQCYTVTNVPPITEKLPNFSDETLFYIFYTYCGDLLQESAAIELTYRSWRWHKTGRFWMTKDPAFAEPLTIDHESERGRYVVFDEKSWSRKSHDMTLHYADLDDHISAAPPNSLPGPMGFS